jgi:hypothetical protein
MYGGGVVSPRSSLTVLANSLASNETYQLMVQMENRQNPNISAIGYLLVQVVDGHPPQIVIG